MLEALQKGDEVVTAGGIARHDHQARRRLRDASRSRRTSRSQVQRAGGADCCCPRARSRALQ